MSMPQSDQSNQFDPDRDSTNSTRPATRAGSAAQSIVGRISPAPAAPRAADVDGGEWSWFSIATLLIVIALAVCGAAAVAAIYGPVFTQPVIGP
jgi:hypothetical protein